MRAVNGTTVIGFTGELSDFDYIMTLLEELNTADFCEDDGKELSPREIYAYLTRVMYNRRNKFDPLWNSLVVAGMKNGESFLGTVGMIGQHYADSHVAAGFGNHMARPLFREKHTDDMSEAEARALMGKAEHVKGKARAGGRMDDRFSVRRARVAWNEIRSPDSFDARTAAHSRRRLRCDKTLITTPRG